MEKIPSFQKDHNKLDVGLHESGSTHGVTTWDLRFKKPNAGDFIAQKALHSIEHMLATVLRNSAHKDEIIYFGPMGCRTGFYLLTVELTREQVIGLLKTCIQVAIKLTEVPGSKKEECGNYLEHDLDGAKKECASYLEILAALA